MNLPEPFELEPIISKEGVQVGFSLPKREDQIRAFNELVLYLRDLHGTIGPAPHKAARPDEDDEMADINGWPVGTSHSISNQGETGYSVDIRDTRFRSWKEAREFAEQMRQLLSDAPRSDRPATTP